MMKEHKVFIVYITKNIVNNKYYIGVHGTTDPFGFDGYIGCGVNIHKPSSYYKPTTPFQYAVKKYGPKKFIRNVIKVFENEDEAYELEAKLVTKETVYSEYFYNVALGGRYPVRVGQLSTIYQYNLNGQFVKEWDFEEAVEFYSTTDSALNGAIINKHRSAGFYWSTEKLDSINLDEYSHPNIPKYIYEYSEEGVCIGMYESLQQTPSKGHICVSLQTGRPYKGHYFSYTLHEKYKPTVHQSYRNRHLYIYNSKGEFEKDVIGIKAVSEYIKCRSTGNIYDAILLRRPCKNYMILDEKVESIEPFDMPLKSKQIDVFDMYGTLLKTYESINEAIRDLHLDNSSAHRVIKGTQRQTKGYILKERKI